jgi:transposase-like protein
MKICIARQQNTSGNNAVECPYCKTDHHRKHGFYMRKGFHGNSAGLALLIPIQRYRCLNTECPHSTFSVLPPMVMRYCRFFWPCLLSLWKIMESGSQIVHQLASMWNVGRKVILRAAALKNIMEPWIKKLYRELTCNEPSRDLGLMVKIITAKIGHEELRSRWYCHRYPQRVIPNKIGRHTICFFDVNMTHC